MALREIPEAILDNGSVGGDFDPAYFAHNRSPLQNDKDRVYSDLCVSCDWPLIREPGIKEEHIPMLDAMIRAFDNWEPE